MLFVNNHPRLIQISYAEDNAGGERVATTIDAIPLKPVEISAAQLAKIEAHPGAKMYLAQLERVGGEEKQQERRK